MDGKESQRPSPSTSEPLVKTFGTAEEWERWLAEHHGSVSAVLVQIAKKSSGIPSVTYDEALDVALCYGWIDGQSKRLDDDYFLQRFTPRRSKSIWSKRNVGKALHLIEAGRMQPAGLAEVEAAQRDGRWQAAYDSPRTMPIPEDFLAALEQNERAKARFATMTKSSTYIVGFRLQTARTPETRQRRLDALIQKLERGEAL